jgi:small subunit ribosomal protein S16
MLKIKLARFGKSNQPHYRIVVIEAKTKRDGQYTDKLGFYAPTQTPKVLQVDVAAYDKWVKNGAQPTDTVNSLVERFRSGNPFPEKKKTLSKKAKAKLAAEAQSKTEAAAAPTQPAEAAPVETPAESVVETPAAEAVPEVTEAATPQEDNSVAQENTTESK